jgi:hypothetical protein
MISRGSRANIANSLHFKTNLQTCPTACWHALMEQTCGHTFKALFFLKYSCDIFFLRDGIGNIGTVFKTALGRKKCYKFCPCVKKIAN